MERASKNTIAELKKQKRENKSLLFLDNIKIAKDALRAGVIEPKFVLTVLSEEEFEDSPIAAALKNFQSVKILRVDEKTLQQLSNTKTPQKVLCIAYHPQYVVEEPKTNFLVLDGLQDPGNVGTLVRTAKATGFETVFLVDSVNVTNDKLVRSSVGAVLSSKVFAMSRAEFVEYANKHNLKLLCCDMDGENIFSFHAKEKVGVVVGNEGQGVSNELRKLCFKTVKIPMKEGIESLNAGVSGSLIMYQLSKDDFV